MRPLALLLALLAAAGPAAAQPAEPFVAGSFTASVRSILGYEETIQGTVRLRLDHVAQGVAVYELDRATLHWRAEGPAGDECTASGEATVTETDPLNAYVAVSADSTYDAGSAASELASDPERVLITCEDYAFRLPAGLLEYLHVPTSAESGSAFRMSPGGHMGGEWGSGQLGDPHFTWDLDGEVPGAAVELVVSPVGYATWMPQGHPTDPDEHGNAITVQAELVAVGGGPAPVEATGFRFELLDVSAEPGVTLNWPRASDAGTDPDLRIAGGPAITDIDVEWGAWAETAAGTTAEVELWAFDYGAFAAIRVVATLEDGREVVGHLRGNRGYTDVRLPMRSSGSFIADVWKAAYGAENLADGADLDGQPDGDGAPGDGLTLYEEYRGFRMGGRHLRTDPTRKDYFLVNSVGALAAPGVALFQRLSGLDVHPEVEAEEEMDTATRVVNPNHARGAHLVDQHGVWLRRFAAGNVGRAVGGPGTPRAVQYVELARTHVEQSASGAFVPPSWFAPHVAHELLHTVDVWHHGDRDVFDGVTWAVRRDPVTGALLRDGAGNVALAEAGRPIEVFTEWGQRTTPLLAQLGVGHPPVPGQPAHPGARVWLADEHGQHSGDDRCVMRYAVAQAYRREGAATERFWTGALGEPVGTGICRTRLGTGINDAARLPRYRHGYADQASPVGRPRRGDCAHQIHVSDVP